jgi:hypothetical protein
MSLEDKKALPPKEAEKLREKQLGQQISKFKEADKEVLKIEYEEYDEDEDYAVIDLEINQESDIYQKFTMLSRRRISQEIMNHLEENAKYVPLYRPLLINVTRPHQTIDGDLLKTIELMVERSLTKRIIDLTVSIKQIKILSTLMVLFGLTAMMISILLSERYLNLFIINEVFYISSWVFVWKAVEGFLFDLRKTTEQKYKLLQIYSADYCSKI